MKSTNIDQVSVVVRRWAKGWDLIIDEDNATNVKEIRFAEQQVRDYLDTVHPDISHANTRIILNFEVDGLEKDIATAQEATREAARQQELAASRIRRIARELRSKGISTNDTASLLGISRARVYQLLQAKDSSNPIQT